MPVSVFSDFSRWTKYELDDTSEYYLSPESSPQAVIIHSWGALDNYQSKWRWSVYENGFYHSSVEEYAFWDGDYSRDGYDSPDAAMKELTCVVAKNILGMSEEQIADCPYCELSKELVNDEDGLGNGVWAFVRDGKLVASASFDGGWISAQKETKINFCPMCGRRL